MLLVKYSNSQLTLTAWPLEERIKAKPKQSGNPLNATSPLESWNLPNPCFKDSHHFMYISNFVTLSNIHFCNLSIKEL